MKYTDYLLKEQFIHIEDLETNNMFLKPIAAVLGVSATVVGFALIGTMLPMAIARDNIRSVKYWMIKNDLIGTRRSYDLILSNDIVLRGFWRSERVLYKATTRNLSKWANLN
jgi:hypothetical protein